MRWSDRLVALMVCLCAGCAAQLGPGGAGTGDSSAGDVAGGGDAQSSGDSATGGDGQPGDPAAGDTRSPVGSDIPAGTVLFRELFEDTDWAGHGWYDGPNGVTTTAEHAPGSTTALACSFAQGAEGCSGGKLGRHAIAETDRVYLSFWVKHSDNWVGSGHGYHPHIFHFVTNADTQWVGPAKSHLTTYIEHPTGRPALALQDSLNNDEGCILRNNDTFVGCGGNFSTYAFTENRSACSCNGLIGELDARDCYDAGDYWYSARAWNTETVYFRDEAGPYDKRDWHFIEAYFELNTIEGGVGIPNGKIRYVYDGEVLISSDNILMRTGAHPDMRFNQFLMAPYIGGGSPADPQQTMWFDDLTVATGRP